MTEMTIAAPAQPDHPPIKLRSPADLVAATPYLLGFHPTDSVVVVAFYGKQLAFVARSDLPGPAEPAGPIAQGIIDVVERQEVDSIAIVGYGPAPAVDPLRQALRDTADHRDLPVKDVLRVEDGRWWSDLCEDPECCPPEGTPVELTTSQVAAQCAYAGLAPAASRRDREREVAPVGGLTRTSMTQATDRAEQRFARLLADLPEPEWMDALLGEGTAAVDAAIARYGEGGTFDDDEVAWLSMLLDVIPVRDAAWAAISTVEPHLRLWTDVTRRADPVLVAAPACLLAFAAWRSGDGVLAGLALERALRADPSCSMARLLLDGLMRGVPPATLADWGTPEWADRVDEDLRRQLTPAPGDRQRTPASGDRQRSPGHPQPAPSQSQRSSRARKPRRNRDHNSRRQ